MKNNGFFVNSGYLGIDVAQLESLGGIYTAKEISQQPKLWLDTYNLLKDQQPQLQKFLDKVFVHENLNIILTGAGTSAFIGDILQGPYQKYLKKGTWAVPTTDLVSHPHQYFYADVPTLLISFARSGNSPESVAAINQSNLLSKRIYHLIITCNPEGELAKTCKSEQSYIFFLPKEADDKSLAMTGSFSSMLLAGMLIARLNQLPGLNMHVDQLINYGRNILDNYTDKIREIANLDFERAVFLGSGPLLGAARESHLKLQELTDGAIICKEDSFLGFRHGPKAVINPFTLLVYLFTNNTYAHKYELDLVKGISNGEKGLFSIGISEHPIKDINLGLNIILSTNDFEIDEEFLAICSVLPAQMLGFFKSLNVGLKPDSPSVRGAISRVVQGVNIYPYTDALGKVVYKL